MFQKTKKEQQTIGRRAIKDTKACELERMYSDLSPCIQLLCIIGIFPVKKEEKKLAKKRVCLNFLLALISSVIHAYWLYVFVISLLSVVRLSRQFKTDFTLSLVNVLVAIIRYSIYRNMHKVRSVIKSVEIFYMSNTKDEYKSIKNAVRAFSYSGSLAAVIIGAISVGHLKNAGAFTRFSQDFVLGLNISSDDSSLFVKYFPGAVFISTIYFDHFIPLIASIYISCVFYILKRAINKFVENIRYDILEGVPDLNAYLLKFNQMIDVVKKVEDLLGLTVFFSFGCLMTNQMCVMNLIIVGSKSSSHPVSVVAEFMVSVKNLIIFLSITFSGALVTEEIGKFCEETKKLVTVRGLDFEKLSLLLQIANSSKISVTIWNIFVLKRSLLLTTASLMTTYGMILMQFSEQGKPR